MGWGSRNGVDVSGGFTDVVAGVSFAPSSNSCTIDSGIFILAAIKKLFTLAHPFPVR